MNQSYQAPRARLLPVLVIFAFILALLYTGFLVFKKLSLSKESDRLATRIDDAKAEIQSMESDQLQELIYAQNMIDQVEERALTWSKIIRKLQELSPVGIFYSSYTASTGNVQLIGIADSVTSVANLITNMELSEDFNLVFIPTLSRAITADGEEVLSFTLELQLLSQ